MNAQPLPGFDLPHVVDHPDVVHNPKWHIKHIFYGDYVFTSESVCKKDGEIKNKFKGYTPIQVPALHINTFSPRDVMAIHAPVLRCLPLPKETFEAKQARRSKPCETDKIIYLPAPKAETPKAHPDAHLIGTTVHVLGIHDQCKIERIFERFDDTWVQMRHPYGVSTRKLSQIYPKNESEVK